jgi:hypothetical protein
MTPMTPAGAIAEIGMATEWEIDCGSLLLFAPDVFGRRADGSLSLILSSAPYGEAHQPSCTGSKRAASLPGLPVP